MLPNSWTSEVSLQISTTNPSFWEKNGSSWDPQIIPQLKAFRLGELLQIRDAVAYGGVPRRGQQQELRRGVELLIATPGRLMDFVNTKVTSIWINDFRRDSRYVHLSGAAYLLGTCNKFW